MLLKSDLNFNPDEERVAFQLDRLASISLSMHAGTHSLPFDFLFWSNKLSLFTGSAFWLRWCSNLLLLFVVNLEDCLVPWPVVAQSLELVFKFLKLFELSEWWTGTGLRD